MSTEAVSTVRHAGSLRLELRHEGHEPEPLPDAGRRQRYWYRVTDTSDPARKPVEGSDLHSGVGAPPDINAMVRTLASFLGAAGEAYEYTMRHSTTPSDNLELFPSWVPEAAYENSDELALLTDCFDPHEPPSKLDQGPRPGPRPRAARYEPRERRAEVSEPGEDPEFGLMAAEADEPSTPWPPARYFNVVFMQDSEGYNLCDLITEYGVDAAIEYLAQWDYGDETVNAAISNGDVHEDVETFHGDRTAVSGPYTLVYNLGFGHASLLKEFAVIDQPSGDKPHLEVQDPPAPPPDASDRRFGPAGPVL